MMYCVGVGTVDNPRYISVCDEYGYSTTSNKLFQFTENQVNEVIKNLRNRLQFKIFVLDMQGNVIFDTNKPKVEAKQVNTTKKGLTLTIRV